MDMPVDVGNNQIIKDCLSHYNYTIENFDTFDFNAAASCFHKRKAVLYIRENEELTAFLDAYPQYRYPGLALPNGARGSVDRCWGQNKGHLTGGGC